MGAAPVNISTCGCAIIYDMKIDDVRNQLLVRLSELKNPRDILKAPELKELLSSIKGLPAEQRADFGAKVNQLRSELAEKADELEQAKQQKAIDPLDVTAPFEDSYINKVVGRPTLLPVENASQHPITTEIDQLVDVFTRMGFICEEARQIDDDYHMFSSLNFPPNHPARDGYDTFRTEEGFIPPAHTTAMESRVLREGKAKLETGEAIAHLTYGRVFRNEDADATHDHTFMQYEGVYVSKNATLAQMLGMLRTFFSIYYGQDLQIRTQPGYFPFTEPSLELLLERPAALGGKDGEWLEMLGCGMLHPNVLREAGVDPEVYQGFAWGGGLERLVMLKYGIEDVRHFSSGKLAFLREFRG